VAHRLALRSGEPSYISNYRFGDVLRDVFSGTLLSVTTDLTDHDDDVGLRVILEGL
jgi:hypothetical protein